MAKVQPELPLDAVQLSETAIPIESTSLSPPKSPRQLPKHLADFKHYVDSKCCYHSVALDSAELADVQPKAAYRCQMKTLMESRDLDWTKKAASWQHETVLFSETLGRAFEDTKRPGRPVGDIWDDYTFDLPSSDSKSTDERPLPECSYLTRCSDCRGKGLVQCQNYECKGSGKITCTRCYGEGKVRTIDYIEYCNCSSGKINCPDCKGGGKIHCSNCKGYGGFRHSVTLRVKWHTCITTLYYQNSFLPEKRMEKAQRVLYWANTQLPWSQNSSIDNFLLSLREDEAHENINLKANLTKQYREKHMKPTSRGSERMRRLICTIERLDFEEVHYTLDEKYVNKRDSTLGQLFMYFHSPCSFLFSSRSSSSSMKNCNIKYGQLRLSEVELYECTANDLIDRGIIGKGSYGVVHKMEQEKSGTMMARVYSNQSVEATEILNELNMFMTENNCLHLIQFYGGLLQEGYCDVFMQLMDTSLDHFYKCVYHKLNQFIPENSVAYVAFTILQALDYLKSRWVISLRSVTPWSILLSRTTIKLIGFDYKLSTGYFPFSKSGNAIELAVEICQGPSLELTIDRLSHHCKEFVNTCLNKDENQRPAYEQLFENPFVQQANEVSQAQHFVSYCSSMIDLVDKTTDTFDQYGFRP
ncbi:unnamed protein product [Rotaria socialis]